MRFLPLPVFLLIASSAQAASFDCAKASHPVEKTICADAELSRLDEQVAALYKQKRDLLFDKAAFKAQQSNWQQILRTQCKSGCPAEKVKDAYTLQLAALADHGEEDYEANYKTSDIETLRITHLSPTQFDFALVREYLDEPEKPKLCRLPANDSEPGAVATMKGPDKAQWSNGEGCTLSFTFERDKTGSVTGISLGASEKCAVYCPDSKFTLGDNFIPNNNWAPGNQ